MLRSKKGQAFDKAYIDNEVAYHKAVNAGGPGSLPGMVKIRQTMF